MRSLTRVLGAVQRLVDQRDDLVDIDEEEEIPTTTDERTLRLLSVKAASAGYAVVATNPTATLTVLRDTGRSIAEPDKALWHPSTISSLDELSQIAKQLGCVIEFWPQHDGKNSGDVIARIQPNTFSEVQRRAFYYGRTSVYGRLERVGGATAMKCGIHMQGRTRMLFCEIESTETVRDLGKFIYTDVVLSGQAVWYRFNNQLKSLTVTSISPAKTDSFDDVAKKIRAIPGGNAWDQIADPEAYIREMRE